MLNKPKSSSNINSNKWLISLDLDGTLIRNDAYTIHPFNIKVLQALANSGHYICLNTGRPIRATMIFYRALQLRTIFSCLNGALIGHIDEKENLKVIRQINIDRKYVLQIINNEFLRLNAANIMLEVDNMPILIRNSEAIRSACHVDTATEIAVGDLNKLFVQDAAQAIFIETKLDVSYEKYAAELNKYKKWIIYRQWHKPGFSTVIINISAVNSNKGTAQDFFRSYYQIFSDNTIAFGDSANDYEMLDNANVSVKMKNGYDKLRVLCNYETLSDNSDGGVGKFLNDFFHLNLTE